LLYGPYRLLVTFVIHTLNLLTTSSSFYAGVYATKLYDIAFWWSIGVVASIFIVQVLRVWGGKNTDLLVTPNVHCLH